MALNNISTSVRNTMCNAFVDAIDSGSTNPNGKLRIYTSGFSVLLAELDFSLPAFGAASNGVATAAAIAQEQSAPASGAAAVFRIVDRAGSTVAEGTVTATGGGGDLQLNTTSIVQFDIVSITSATITMPAG